MGLVPCIAVSTGYVLLTCLLAESLRKLVSTAVPNGLGKTALLEAIAGAELCGAGFELIIIADNYGVLAYSVFLFALTIWWGQVWGDATACPYFHFESLYEGSMQALEVAVRTIAATFGGVAVFKYIQVLWALEIAETHAGRAHSAAFDHCSADLQVPVLYGAIIEGVATLLCRLTSKYLGDLEPRYAAAIDSFVATSLVVAAFDYSGGYYNPVLATGLKFGCRGHSHFEHFIVYWIGASLGALASIFAYPPLKNSLGVKKLKEA
eukprot:06732.XXX_105051_103143_1 [CDS] Oithona nana genome sequencing.